jgi:fructosamine-3-kinase
MRGLARVRESHAVSWKSELAEAVGARVAAAEPVVGGDINYAYRVRLDDKRVVFVKTHAQPPPDMFRAEAMGLDWLRAGRPASQASLEAIDMRALRVPEVVAAGDHFLALEWLETGARGGDFDAALGRGLAVLHARGAPSFGLAGASYLGTLPQDNTPELDGPTFWIERRVRPLCDRARSRGAMPDIGARLDALLAKRDRFGPVEPPARLHGDLWWGNVIAVGPGGQPAIVDPAVYGGHREVDLAMLALFGGMSVTLLDAYSEVAPLADGWRDRVALWQLYPLAAHAVLFGGGYGAQVVHSLDRLA